MVHNPRALTAEGLDRMVSTFSRIPIPLLKLLEESQLRFVIFRTNIESIEIDGMALRNPCQSGAAAYYHIFGHVIALREQHLCDWVCVHELAHAVEVVLNDKFRLGKPIAHLLEVAFQSQRLRTVTAYAQTNPREYFAESFAAHFATDVEMKERLQRCDPAMAALLQVMETGGSLSENKWLNRIRHYLSPFNVFRSGQTTFTFEAIAHCSRKTQTRQRDVANLELFFARALTVRSALSVRLDCRTVQFL